MMDGHWHTAYGIKEQKEEKNPLVYACTQEQRIISDTRSIYAHDFDDLTGFN